jgi:hypothetical protein
MSFWYYTTSGAAQTSVERMVWIDDRLVGRVQPVLGGWIFYDADDTLTAVGVSRDETVHLGLTHD